MGTKKGEQRFRWHFFCSHHFHQNEIGQCFTLKENLRTKMKQRQNEKKEREKIHTHTAKCCTFFYGNARGFETWKSLFFLYERFNQKLSSKKA